MFWNKPKTRMIEVEYNVKGLIVADVHTHDTALKVVNRMPERGLTSAIERDIAIKQCHFKGEGPDNV